MSNSKEINNNKDVREQWNKVYSNSECEINFPKENISEYSSGISNSFHCEKVHISPEKLKTISTSPGMEKLIGIQRLEVDS